MLNFITWTVDPVLLNLGPLTVRWYGLLWAIGFILGYVIETRIYKRDGMPDEAMDKLFLFMVFGTIIGARIGHCFFYEWDYFSHHLIEVLYIWQGGLSSHGGAIGILTVLWFFARYQKKSYLWVLDRVVIAVAICGACIRLGNLMNHEIYGDPTTMPWAFSFMLHPLHPDSSFSEPSHPTQLYEMTYCLLTFALLMYLYWKTEARKKEGLLFGVFLITIFLTRYLLEFIKNPQVDVENNMVLNIGQLLSIPFFAVGIILVFYHLNRWRIEAEMPKKPIALMSVLGVTLALLIIAPLVHKMSQKTEQQKVAAIDLKEKNFKPMQTDSAGMMAYLEGKKFSSTYGLTLEIKGDALYQDGQKTAGPLMAIPSSGDFYLIAPGLKQGNYHYLIRPFENGKSVILNLDDSRGNYYLAK